MKLSEWMLQKLKNRIIQFESLDDTYFIEIKIYDHEIGYELEFDNISKLLNSNICSFQQIVDKLKDIRKKLSNSNDNNHTERKKHDLLFWTSVLVKDFIKNNMLTEEDLRYFLYKTTEFDELDELCSNNIPLLKRSLNEVVFDENLIDNFNALIKNEPWLKNEFNIHDLFDFIEHHATHDCMLDYDRIKLKKEVDHEVLKLNELNRYMYAFELTKEQRSELIETLKNNEIALSRVKDIVENHLEPNYDFESLMVYLKKKEKKNVLNI